MKMLRFLVLAAVPAITFAVLGCSSSSTEPSDEGLYPTGGVGTVAAALTAVDDSKGLTTITGTVTLDGDAPVMGELPGLLLHGDATVCLAGGPDETHEQTWVVDGGSRGVANVVVWVSPPPKQFFKKPADEKAWKDKEVDQPHCAFKPHVVLLYPEYYDPASSNRVPTGQKLVVMNTAPIAHNIRVAGNSQINSSKGGKVDPHSRYVFDSIRVDKQALSMNCDIHKWMNGYAYTLDHPYGAVTDAQGHFKIENVPAGSEVTIQAWHEALNKFTPEVAGGAKIKLEKDKPVELSFKVRSK